MFQLSVQERDPVHSQASVSGTFLSRATVSGPHVLSASSVSPAPRREGVVCCVHDACCPCVAWGACWTRHTVRGGHCRVSTVPRPGPCPGDPGSETDRPLPSVPRRKGETRLQTNPSKSRSSGDGRGSRGDREPQSLSCFLFVSLLSAFSCVMSLLWRNKLSCVSG